MQLSTNEINLVRQWFNSIQDVNPNYLQKADNELYLKVLAEYNRPPNTQLKLGACANADHCISLDNGECAGPNCHDYKRTT